MSVVPSPGPRSDGPGSSSKRGGTLFLDEIGEIPLSLQAKLLRMLETRRFRRLGGTADLDADVRVVAATNSDLEAMARSGEFRQDLLFRLNVFVVLVPPLRDRRGDILPLVRHFLAYPGVTPRIAKRLSSSALKQLLDYDWPGNVRELRNAIERAVILSGHRVKIDVEHFSLGQSPPQPATSETPSGNQGVALLIDHEPTLVEIERHYLSLLLGRKRRSRAELVRVLGVGECTLYRLLADLKGSVDLM